MTPNAGEVLRDILRRDPRYPRDAYRFVFEGLDHTLRTLERKGHVNGKELLDGIRDFALSQFGGLAPMVFAGWGITRTDDFGEIVFNLVEAGLMGRTDADSKDDFHNVFDFSRAFRIEKAATRAKRTP